MIGGYLRAAGLAAVVALLTVTHWQAYSAGADRVERRVEREAADLRRARDAAERLAARREAARLAAEAEADRLAQELEDAARSDPGAGGVALGADSVHRIDRR
jgi:F0F1-type ATP synthase membrane subunit b/b'